MESTTISDTPDIFINIAPAAAYPNINTPNTEKTYSGIKRYFNNTTKQWVEKTYSYKKKLIGGHKGTGTHYTSEHVDLMRQELLDDPTLKLNLSKLARKVGITRHNVQKILANFNFD